MHNLAKDAITGEARFAANQKGGLPWHGLGVLTPDAMTTADAIKKAKLDYTVLITPNLIEVPAGTIVGPNGDLIPNIVKVPTDSRSTYFLNEKNEVVVLGGKLGAVYDVFQNVDAFNFFDKIVGEGKAIIETAGALGNGESVFITAKLPESLEIAVPFRPKDQIDLYVVLTHSHDGSGAIKAFFTPIRVVCENTLNAALGKAQNTISVRHTATANDRLEAKAASVWGMVMQNIPVFSEAMTKLAKVRITDPKVIELLELVFPGKKDENGEYSTRITNIRETVLKYYHEHETQKSWIGTGYGFYNAITGYLGNVKGFDHKDNSIRFRNLVDDKGADYAAKKTALDLVMAL